MALNCLVADEVQQIDIEAILMGNAKRLYSSLDSVPPDEFEFIP